MGGEKAIARLGAASPAPKMEARGAGVQGQPLLHTEFEDSPERKKKGREGWREWDRRRRKRMLARDY